MGTWENPDEYGLVDPDNFNGSQGPMSAKTGGSRGRSKDKGGRNRSQASPQSQGRGGKQSSMIEKEMQQLEKIKARQQKEIEAMMDAERKNEEIREKNKLKEIKEGEREAKRAAEIDEKHRLQEIKKAGDEKKRQEAALREEKMAKMVLEKAL